MFFKPKNNRYFQIWLACVILAIVVFPWSMLTSFFTVIISTTLVLFFKSMHEVDLRRNIETSMLSKFQHEQRLNLLQEQLDILMTYYPHPMVLFNQRGQQVLSNASFIELISFKDHKLMYDDKRLPRAILKIFKQAYYQEVPMIQDLTLEQQFYSAHCLPIYVEGRYQGFLCVLQDVTRLVQQDKLQKRFVADASHELKTPITAIKGISELLLRTPLMSHEDRLDFTQQVYDQSHRLEQIVKDMLTLSKLSEDKMMIVKQPNNAKALLEEILSSFNVAFSQHQLKVSLNVNDKTVLYVDKKAFESIMSNLITNVMIHASASELIIQVIDTLEFVRIIVSDNGKGIDAEHLNHIFERFYRASSSRQRASGGSGLGLNITRSFIFAHQGSIEVESQPNQGCKFTLSFPKLTLS
jgi:two-component system, OmpR family, phosphate regulon sensor histidine kinase PhoR